MTAHKDNPHFVKFDLWRRTVAARLLARRGGSACLARHLGVSRQSVSRWLRGPTPMPPWAAVAANIWWAKVHEEFPPVLFAAVQDERPRNRRPLFWRNADREASLVRLGRDEPPSGGR